MDVLPLWLQLCLPVVGIHYPGPVPDKKAFFELLQLYFLTIYDIKYTTSLCDGHSGGLTISSYFALDTSKFTKNRAIDNTRGRDKLYGYGSNHTVKKGHILSAHGNSNSIMLSMNGNSNSVH